MAEPVLDQPRVVASIGQGVAACVAQHVSMDPKRQLGAAMSALGQKRTSRCLRSMSALPPKADIAHVRFTLESRHRSRDGCSHFVVRLGLPAGIGTIVLGVSVPVKRGAPARMASAT